MTAESILIQANQPKALGIRRYYQSALADYGKMRECIINTHLFFPRNLIIISSLPCVSRINAFNLAHTIDVDFGSIVELGNNCSSILQALHLSAVLYEDASADIIIYCEDRFSSYVDRHLKQSRPSTAEWKNYTSAIFISAKESTQVKILSYVSLTDTSYHDMVMIGPTDDQSNVLRFNEQKLEEFRAIDLNNELRAIMSGLNSANLRIESIDAFVTTNRELDRTQQLIKALKIKDSQLVSSRKVIGHTGSSDIIYNLDRAFSQISSFPYRILISSNGLGYNWSTMVLSVESSL